MRLSWLTLCYLESLLIVTATAVNIDAEMKLSDKTFEEELRNKSSPAYKELEQNVHDELHKILKDTPGFVGIEILGIVEGSVKVIFRVEVVKLSNESDYDVAVKLGRKINNQGLDIGNITVVPDSIKLKVRPPPPANVTYSNVEETSVRIQWDPPELHEMFSIERYYITYLKYGAKNSSNKTIYGTRTQLDNLESDTLYIITVIAENSYGLSSESKRIEIKTRRYKVRPPPPANVTYSNVEETSVRIQWNPPEFYEMYTIERYYITYLKYGAKNSSNKTINGTRTQLDNLESDTLYIITIIAENSYGLSSESERIEIKTRRYKAEAIVDIDMEIKLSNKTFKEELNDKSSPAYKELAKNVYVELYTFFYDTPGFEDVEILGFGSGSVKVIFRVKVKVAEPSKESKDVVAAKVGRKIFEQIKTGRITNLLVVPDSLKLKVRPPAPRNVTYSDVEETKVLIYWDPPELHKMYSIERYYVAYSKYGTGNWTRKTILAGQLTNTQLSSLDSDTFYTLTTFSENAHCLSLESNRINIKTRKKEDFSSWYYVGPIIAVACVVFLVTAFFVARKILNKHTQKVTDGKPNRNIALYTK